MYSNNILNFKESTTIINAYTEKVWKTFEGTTYIKYKISKHILYIEFLNESEYIFLFMQLNGFANFYQIRIILFTINHFFATGKCFQVFRFNTKNSNKHQSFVYTVN